MAPKKESMLEKQLRDTFAKNLLLPAVKITYSHLETEKGIEAMMDSNYATASRHLAKALEGTEAQRDRAFLYAELIKCSKAIFNQSKSEADFKKVCDYYKALIETNEIPSNYISYMSFLSDELFTKHKVSLIDEAIEVGKIATTKFPENADLHVWMHRLYDWNCNEECAYASMMKVCKLNYSAPAYLFQQFGDMLFEPAFGSDDKESTPINALLKIKGEEILKNAFLLSQYGMTMLLSRASDKNIALRLLMDAYELNRSIPGLKDKMFDAYAIAFNSAKDSEAKAEIRKKFNAFCEKHKIAEELKNPEAKLGALLSQVSGAGGYAPAKKSLETKVMLPSEVKKEMDKYIVGQEEPKRALSVALYTHLLRIERKARKGLNDIDKSNVLILGPTGCGKTYMARVLAKIAKVPFILVDTSKVTSAGYVGANAEDCLASLIMASGGDVELAQIGIVYLDEADKIKVSHGTGKDVGGEGAQQQFLKLLEGSLVNVSVGEGSYKKNIQFDTSHVLFIVGGAFSDSAGKGSLASKIADRIGASSIGFKSEAKDIDMTYGVGKVLRQLSDRDLQDYGFLPEFAGRLHNRIVLDNLSRDELRRILVEPIDAVIPQYQRLFDASGIKLVVAPEALDAIADEAFRLKAGARSLRTICDAMFKEPLFALPGSATKEFRVDRAYVIASMERGRL